MYALQVTLGELMNIFLQMNKIKLTYSACQFYLEFQNGFQSFRRLILIAAERDREHQ